MKKIGFYNFIKLGLIIFVITSAACAFNRDNRSKTKTTTLRINSTNLNLYSHFKNGNFIISVSDEIGDNLKEQYLNPKDSSTYKLDTIDLETLDTCWKRQPVSKVLRDCIETKEAKIFSISESKYIYKIKRTVSKSKFKEIRSNYLYTSFLKGDTILYSYSFDTGTPPF